MVKRVRLSDIAEKLDVSVSLVSLVLSNKGKEARISENLRRKVIETAQELGYTPNQVAKGLRTGRSYTIGLIVADISNPYFGKMARNIENEAARHGYQVMFGSSDENPEKLQKLLDVFMSRQVDGIIIVPVVKCEKYIQSIRKRSIPFVLIDRYCSENEMLSFVSDNYLGAYLLTRHMIEKGRTRICMVTEDADLSIYSERSRGFEAAIKETGIKVTDGKNIFTIHSASDNTEFETMIADIRGLEYDGIFFANNRHAIKAIGILNRMGICIPEDLAISSFDNPEAFSITSPGITCYEQPADLISEEAIKSLIEVMNKNNPGRKGTNYFPGRLIIRESC